MKDEREEARDYFKNRRLSYKSIYLTHIRELRKLIKYELQTYLPTTNHSRQMDMRLHKERKKDLKFNRDDFLIEGGIWIDGSYFESREGLYFNSDGFIGFCGWADCENKMPFIIAFKKWCDWLCSKCQQKQQILEEKE